MPRILVNGFSFDWDEDKNLSNQILHNISFELAATIWALPELVREISDTRKKYPEDRWIAIGQLPHDRRSVVLVAYCDRDDDIRIISARYAEGDEEPNYRKSLRTAKP